MSALGVRILVAKKRMISVQVGEHIDGNVAPE